MNKTRTAATLGCMAAAVLAAPSSYGQESGWYVGASIGRSAATIDNDRITRGLAGQGLSTTSIDDRDTDTGYKLLGGYQLNRNFGIEAGGFDLGKMGYTATTSPAGTLNGDVRVRGVNFDLVGTLPLSESFSLLGRVGAAYSRSSGTFSSGGAVTVPYAGTSLSTQRTDLKFGGGVSWRLSNAWELRAEAERYRIADTVGNRGPIDLVTVGIIYRFGDAAPAPRAVAPAPAMVAAAPEPAPAPMVAVLPPPAPEPPAPPPPPPPPPVSEKVSFAADAFYDFDKAVLKPEGMAKLDDLVSKMQGINLEVIIAVGHTDSDGDDAYNLKLSAARAESVKAYMTRKGIEQNRIYTEGKGEKQPVADNKTKEGKQKNRRVEIEVVGTRTRN